MVDALVLEYTDTFLLYLQDKRLFNLSKIKIKYFHNWANTSHTIIFDSLSDFEYEYNYILKNTQNGEYCTVGSYPVIENITIENTNLPFDNSFIIANASSSKMMIRNKIKYDSYRTDFYSDEIQRYIKLLYEDFSLYRNKVFELRELRENLYVDPCYVNADYVI